jgi:superfamily II DNA or RNA helicase
MLEARKMGAAGMKLVSLISKRKTLLSEAHNKPPEVYRIVKDHEGEKVIIFSESIHSIEKARKYLEPMGAKVGMYHSKNKYERDSKFKEWVEGKFQVLMSVRALDEGIDVPEAKVGIVIASGRGKRQWTQRIGRILRKTGRVAQLYIVYCSDSYEKDFPKQVERLMRGIE